MIRMISFSSVQIRKAYNYTSDLKLPSIPPSSSVVEADFASDHRFVQLSFIVLLIEKNQS